MPKPKKLIVVGDRVLPLYLFYFTAATVFHFTSKETSYIYTAQALLFLAMYFVYRVHKRPWPNTTNRQPFFILFYIGILAITAAMILIIVGKKAAPPATETLAPAIPGAEAAAGVTQLITPIGIIAIVLAGLALLAAGYFLVKGYTWKLIRAERSFDL